MSTLWRVLFAWWLGPVWNWFWGWFRPLWDRLSEWWWRMRTPRLARRKDEDKDK